MVTLSYTPYRNLDLLPIFLYNYTMKPPRILQLIGTRFDEAVELVVGSVAIFMGAWVVSPTYNLNTDTPSFVGHVPWPLAKFIGALFLFGGSAAVLGIKRSSMRNSQKLRKVATFTLFLAFLFLALLRILVFGFSRLVWPSAMGMSLVSAALYLRLWWEAGKNV